tara:strand:+ start:25118 stop:26422 length:1305 start_codon:yes stop_codon:yes gene_type:complete
MQDNLIDLIKTKRAVVGIVGLGYVGLPLVLRFTEVGFRVVGFDIDAPKVAMLNAGQSSIEHISNDKLARACADGFEATGDFARAAEVDVLILCVPTPLSKYREPDLSYVINTVENLVPHIRAGQLMSLESTTYPGTTSEELATRISARGFTVGADYFLVYSPEREDPANPDFTTRTIPKVCGGETPECLAVGVALYSEVIDRVVPVSSTHVAELTKLLENIHRAVNIGLVNEMKVVADKMGINIREVIDAAATKPFGFVPYYPGPGLGGHCIPIDPFYLTWKAREFGVSTRFIELAGEVNGAMPDYVVDKIKLALNDRFKPVRGSKILVLGIAYKPNVDDVRESPSVFIMERLRDLGAVIAYHDPHVARFPKMREHFFDLDSVELGAETLASYDCVLVATNHERIDFEAVRQHATLIVDTRGVYPLNADHIVNA